METEGLLAVGANAGNSAGALAAPFARQSRSPTKPGALGATHRSAWGNGWELGFARRREAEGLLAVGANAGNSAGAPAAPFARQSRSPTSPGALGAAHRRAWGSGWELGFARRREAEGLLAVGANAGNSAGAPAAPFARQSRSPTSPGALGAAHRRAWGNSQARLGQRVGAGLCPAKGGRRAPGGRRQCRQHRRAPAAPFARQSRSPTSPGRLGRHSPGRADLQQTRRPFHKPRRLFHTQEPFTRSIWKPTCAYRPPSKRSFRPSSPPIWRWRTRAIGTPCRPTPRPTSRSPWSPRASRG